MLFISQRTQTTTNLIKISVMKFYVYFDQYHSLASWHSCLLHILHFLPNRSIWFGWRENGVAAILHTYRKKVVNGIYKNMCLNEVPHFLKFFEEDEICIFRYEEYLSFWASVLAMSPSHVYGWTISVFPGLLQASAYFLVKFDII